LRPSRPNVNELNSSALGGISDKQIYEWYFQYTSNKNTPDDTWENTLKKRTSAEGIMKVMKEFSNDELDAFDTLAAQLLADFTSTMMKFW